MPVSNGYVSEQTKVCGDLREVPKLRDRFCSLANVPSGRSIDRHGEMTQLSPIIREPLLLVPAALPLGTACWGSSKIAWSPSTESTSRAQRGRISFTLVILGREDSRALLRGLLDGEEKEGEGIRPCGRPGCSNGFTRVLNHQYLAIAWIEVKVMSTAQTSNPGCEPNTLKREVG